MCPILTNIVCVKTNCILMVTDPVIIGIRNNTKKNKENEVGRGVYVLPTLCDEKMKTKKRGAVNVPYVRDKEENSRSYGGQMTN